MKLQSKALFVVVLLMLFGSVAFSGTIMASENEQQAQFVPPTMIVNTSFLNIRTGPGTEYSVLVIVVGGTELPVLGVFSDGVWYQVSTVAGVGWLNREWAIDRGSYRDVPLVEAPEVGVYGEEGMAVDGTSSGGMASGSSSRGWGVSISQTYTAIIGNMDSGIHVEVPADPNYIYPILDVAVTPGNVRWFFVDHVFHGGLWLESIRYSHRAYGCNDYVVSFAGGAYLGMGPDKSGNVDGWLLPAGQEAYLLGAIPEQSLYKVETVGGEIGWAQVNHGVTVREPGTLATEYCTSGSTGAAPSGMTTTSTSSVNPRFAAAHIVINTGNLNIRSGPGATYSVLATLPGGTELAVTGFAPDGVWYRVAGSFGQGWVNSELTIFRGNGTGLPIVRDHSGVLDNAQAVIGNAVNLFIAPDGATLIGAISGPVTVDVVARTADSNWVQLNTSLGFGWVHAAGVSLTGNVNAIPVVGN
jgi:uncharacterized protein YraI